MKSSIRKLSLLFLNQPSWINARINLKKILFSKMMLRQKMSRSRTSFLTVFVRRKKRKGKYLYFFQLWYWKFIQVISTWINATELHFSQWEDWCQPTIKIVKKCQTPQFQLPLMSNRKMSKWNRNKERTSAVFTEVDSTWRKSLEWDVERPNLLYRAVTSGQAEIQTSC